MVTYRSEISAILKSAEPKVDKKPLASASLIAFVVFLLAFDEIGFTGPLEEIACVTYLVQAWKNSCFTHSLTTTRSGHKDLCLGNRTLPLLSLLLQRQHRLFGRRWRGSEKQCLRVTRSFCILEMWRFGQEECEMVDREKQRTRL